MKKSRTFRSGRHCVFLLHAHLVFVTKYRRAVFSKKMFTELQEIFEDICNNFEARLVEFDGEKDHVHLLVEYPPKCALSKLVNSLKGVSSRLLRKKYKKIRSYCLKDMLWSPSYFAGSCGGAPITIIRQYIENQKTPV